MRQKNQQPLVYVVTPVFNGRDHTDLFLKSLEKQTYTHFKTIIIDDRSTDGTRQFINKNYPRTILLKGDGTLWWSGGTNKGVKYARSHHGDYVLTINNDVEVPTDYIANLVIAAASNPHSLIGSLVVTKHNPDKVWYAGATFDKKTGEMRHRSGRRAQFTTPILTSEWLTGMGVLIPIQTFDDIGLYDAKNFPHYFGDADFSTRARLNGYHLLVSTRAVVHADITSAWIYKQLAQPSMRMFTDLFTSIRSAYRLKTRIAFYRRYWGAHWRLQLFTLYFWTLKRWYAKLIITYLLSLPRRLLIRTF